MVANWRRSDVNTTKVCCSNVAVTSICEKYFCLELKFKLDFLRIANQRIFLGNYTLGQLMPRSWFTSGQLAVFDFFVFFFLFLLLLFVSYFVLFYFCFLGTPFLHLSSLSLSLFCFCFFFFFLSFSFFNFFFTCFC